MANYIDYFDKEKGAFLYNGIEYECFDEVIGLITGWCLCGDPNQAQESLMKAMRHIHNLKELVWTKKQTWEEWNANGKKLFGRWEYLMYYVIDEKGWSEHGGSVPGWLTHEGVETLELLESFYNQRSTD